MPLVDVIAQVFKDRSQTINVLDKGFVKLIDVMPRMIEEGTTCDSAITQMARISYGDGTKTISEDETLIRYLYRNQHSSPIESCEIKFHIKCPIFVQRQIIRHRTASVNEISGRYSVLKEEFYSPNPEDIRQQSIKNKQSSDGNAQKLVSEQFVGNLTAANECTYEDYEKATEGGVAREQARMILPVNLYTEFYMKIDLHNLLHFLALRTHSHAQYETQLFAEAILSLIEPLFPMTINAWNDYHHMRGGMKLSREEVAHLKTIIGGAKILPEHITIKNNREKQEFISKLKVLDIIC